MAEVKAEACCLPCKDAKTRDWSAWNDLQPPIPDYCHVVGEVCVANPGVDPMLTTTASQPINPNILALELYLCQRPGTWPQVMVWKPVRYEKKIDVPYETVEIWCGGDKLTTIDVIDVHAPASS